MHGVGIRAMGKLMDRMMGSIDPRDRNATKVVRRELAAIAPLCRWRSVVDTGNETGNGLPSTHGRSERYTGYS
jgi:hypothetical protein